MVSGFTIAEGDASEAPEPDVAYTISDDRLDGPTPTGPIDFLAFDFDGTVDRTITVNLTEGEMGVQTPDPEQPFEGDPTQDAHTILVTVS